MKTEHLAMNVTANVFESVRSTLLFNLEHWPLRGLNQLTDNRSLFIASDYCILRAKESFYCDLLVKSNISFKVIAFLQFYQFSEYACQSTSTCSASSQSLDPASSDQGCEGVRSWTSFRVEFRPR